MENNNVRAVSRAMDILEVIRKKGGDIGVTEVSQEVGLAKSTVYRLLETLLEKGMLQKDRKMETYSLGYKVLELAFSASTNWNLINLATPYLEQLRDMYNETTALAIKVGLNYSYIAEFVSHHEFRVNPILGRQFPLHWSGAGKAILAFIPKEEQNEVLKIAPTLRSTPNTITDTEVLLKQIEQIQKDGYSASFGERAEGAAVIASPIRDRHNHAIAAFCLIGSDTRLRKMDLPSTGKVIMEMCQKIEMVSQSMEHAIR